MVKCARIWRPVSRAQEPRPPLNLAVFGLDFILRMEEVTLRKRNEKLNRIEGTSKLFQRGECLGRRRPHGHMFPLGLAGGRTLVPKENTSVAPALNSRTTSMTVRARSDCPSTPKTSGDYERSIGPRRIFGRERPG